MIRPIALATVGRITGADIQPIALATLGRLTLMVVPIVLPPEEDDRGPGYPESDMGHRLMMLHREDDEILAVLMAFFGVKQ